jgi:hypothetical protein
MKRYLAAFLIILTISTSAYSRQHKKNGNQLIFAFDIIRHGYRSPIKNIPNMTEKSWDVSATGTLTPLGAEGSQEAGRRLKGHYIDKLGFIDSNPSKDSIYVVSTDMERTISTAKNTLRGMFGENASNITVNVATSELLKTPKSRDGMTTMIFDTLDSKKKKEFDDMITYLNNKFNLKMSTVEEIMAFGDLLSVNRTHNKSYPESELPKDKVDQLLNLREYLYLYRTSVNKFMCQASEKLLIHAVQELNDKTQNKVPYKIELYFAHDSNILSVLNLLNKLPKSIPPYNSDLRFELYGSNDSDYYVKVLLNDRVIPVCGRNLCELKQFSNLVDENIKRKCT